MRTLKDSIAKSMENPEFAKAFKKETILAKKKLAKVLPMEFVCSCGTIGRTQSENIAKMYLAGKIRCQRKKCNKMDEWTPKVELDALNARINSKNREKQSKKPPKNERKQGQAARSAPKSSKGTGLSK
jgi:hypothetical protein